MKPTPLPTLKPAALLLLLIMAAAATAEAVDMEARLQACASCHDNSNSDPQGQYAPSIAGKPREYLYQQLLNFQEGRRLNKSMNTMLAYLSEGYLREIAGYFSEMPKISTPARKQRTTLTDDELAEGRRLSHQGRDDIPACAACHGGDLRGDGTAIPSLEGLGADYISAQLGAWKAGTRRAQEPDCMAEIAQQLTGAEINRVVHWIAAERDWPASIKSAEAPAVDYPLPCGAVQ